MNCLIFKVNPVLRVVLSFILAILQTFSYSLCSRFFLFSVSSIIAFLCCPKIKVNFKFLGMILSVVFISSFFCSGGEPIVEFGFLKLSREFFISFIRMMVSTMTFWMFSFIFLNSISPSEVSYVIDRLMLPLKKFNIDVNEISMVVTLALRFMPVIFSESKKIMIVQEARGAKISRGSLFSKIKFMIPVFVPIFFACFRRAVNISLAMESRCYGAPYERTNLYKNKVGWADLMFCIFTLFIIIGVLYCNHIKIFWSF